MLKQRDLLKEVIRTHASTPTATWEEAAQAVGYDPSRLAHWRRRPEWPTLCREVGEEELARALPVAVRRLVETARSDKSSSGVTAAKALIDICLDRGPDQDAVPADGAIEEFDLGALSPKEREIACRVFATLAREAATE
jgi:hypothetical protein